MCWILRAYAQRIADVQPQSDADLVAGGLLTVAAACELLAVSRSFLYARMDAGEIPYCRLGRARRIPRRAAIAFAAARLNTNGASE
jgi:excisionase family DNA binding protein